MTALSRIARLPSLALAFVFVASASLAQNPEPSPSPSMTPTSAPTVAATPAPDVAAPSAVVPMDQLMAITPLPDIVQGSPSAPNTIIEYASMLARCAGADKRNALVDILYTQQKAWAFVDKPIEPLLALVKQVGLSQTDFETCLRNQDLYEQVNQSRDRAAEAFNIDSTPTFFVNGRKVTGEATISDFDRAMDGAAK